MKKMITTLLLVSVLTKLSAQQNIQVTMRQKANGIASMETKKGQLSAVAITRNLMRFRKLKAMQDGDIRYKVTEKAMNERINIRFRSEIYATEIYEIQLREDGYYITHPNKPAWKVGTYQVGDEFKILRCKQGIMFYKNNRYIETATITTKDYVVFGEVIVLNTTISRANIWFTPYSM